jgi:ribonuclease P protein component
VRLRKRSEFLAVQNHGRPHHARHFLVIAANAATEHGRVGITVSGKVGMAVVRNRIKRWVRETVRRSQWLPSGLDVVVIAKPSAETLRSRHEVALDLARVKLRAQS